MNYDDAVKTAQPSMAIKWKFYSDYIEPYLKREPSGQELAYFINQGWHAWRLNVKKEDVKNMLFVEWMCEQLYIKEKKAFSELVSYLLDDTHDAQIRTHSSEKAFYEAKTVEEKFTSAVRHYKIYFETELRLWGTVPYFFVCKILKSKNEGSTPDTYVKISASTKYFKLKEVKIVLPKGDIKELMKGFDNELRNAGEGHDSYELTDNNTILMHVINPKTGKPVGSEKRELTYGQLDMIISTCRKSIWVLRNGLYIFLNNNPNFRKELQVHRPLKISEIKSAIESFAEERSMNIDKFIVTQNRQRVDLSIGFMSKSETIGGELLFGNGERYEIINVRITEQAKYQIISIFQNLVYLFRKGFTPTIYAEVFDDKKKLLTKLEYEPKELIKFFLPKKEENIPIPKVGIVPDFPTKYVGEVKIPYGMKTIGIKLLKAQGYDVIG